MKVIRLLPLFVIAISACVHSYSSEQNCKTSENGKFEDCRVTGTSFIIRYVDPEIFDALGVSKRNLMLATNDNNPQNPTIIFAPKTFKNKPLNTSNFIPNRKLVNFTTIFPLENSPACMWVHDGVGGKIWYPPPCPN